MDLNFTHDGRGYTNFSPTAARAAAIPEAVIIAALKRAASAAIALVAAEYRAQLSSASAGKLDEYRIKEAIAADPLGAAPGELEMIDREAAARGIDRDALLLVITDRARAARRVALWIGAFEAEAHATINAIPDTAPGAQTTIEAALARLKSEADKAAGQAAATLGGA
ncbi:hypothetical protein [Profundibacterium mesophilum]|uniref:Uncharacterized protein n=1 Tax=Profundibacterium mesophilum KAUST100406-0324 TaxID=1037889 RepID=A0A921NQU8_9RHOB|nr:hypothetical protein [Profundibacterium mesophilum]KAF0676732.1 hypothetical protein PMES_00919 [Profundibacterium mesophilum KAUST100406-0324]